MLLQTRSDSEASFLSLIYIRYILILRGKKKGDIHIRRAAAMRAIICY